jgi:hypothetical protein
MEAGTLDLKMIRVMVEVQELMLEGGTYRPGLK